MSTFLMCLTTERSGEGQDHSVSPPIMLNYISFLPSYSSALWFLYSLLKQCLSFTLQAPLPIAFWLPNTGMALKKSFFKIGVLLCCPGWPQILWLQGSSSLPSSWDHRCVPLCLACVLFDKELSSLISLKKLPRFRKNECVSFCL